MNQGLVAIRWSEPFLCATTGACMEMEMSRILFDSVVHGKTLPIALGWDRRLSQCFLSVNVFVLDEDDDEDPRFEAVFDASAMGMRPGLDVADCKAILETAGVLAPTGTFELLAEHRARNAGNVVVKIAADGAQTVVVDEDKVPL